MQHLFTDCDLLSSFILHFRDELAIRTYLLSKEVQRRDDELREQLKIAICLASKHLGQKVRIRAGSSYSTGILTNVCSTSVSVLLDNAEITLHLNDYVDEHCSPRHSELEISSSDMEHFKRWILEI